LTGYTSTQDLHDLEALRGRTPSPTPSEGRAMRGSQRENIKFLLRTKPCMSESFSSSLDVLLNSDVIPGYIAIFAVIIVLVILIAVYNEQIINWLKPVTQWLHE
jgi:hypothetical protein